MNELLMKSCTLFLVATNANMLIQRKLDNNRPAQYFNAILRISAHCTKFSVTEPLA